MQRISLAQIQTLSKEKNQPAVSIYMPTRGLEFADNRAYLKRLLSRAREELNRFASYKEKHEALYPAYRLLHDREWWRFVDSGVAIFSSKSNLDAFHLSERPVEEIAVSDRFHILPLLNYLNHRSPFYVLALSAKNNRLLHCDGEDIYELSVPNMPRSIADMDITEDHSLVRSKEKSSKPHLRNALISLREGGKRAIKRGHQDVLENQYLQQVYHAIHGVLANHHEPLVLAGLHKTQALYRKIDHSDYLNKEGLTVNPDRVSNLELRDRARQLLGDYFYEHELNAQSHFLRLSVARPDKIVYGLKNVLSSVYQGRVQTLYVEANAKVWGNIKKSLVELHRHKRGGDADLLDVAAGETVKRQGKVFTLDNSDLPKGVKVAAILRY